MTRSRSTSLSCLQLLNVPMFAKHRIVGMSDSFNNSELRAENQQALAMLKTTCMEVVGMRILFRSTEGFQPLIIIRQRV